tara:strand:- start:1716 stop:2021 length:306 start_codon:yes stop_codon:yes gene_type:complete
MKITTETLRQIIREEILHEVSIASGERTVPASGLDAALDGVETIGGGVEGSPAELAARLNDAILYLRGHEQKDPVAGTIADELIKMQKELDHQAAHLSGEE